MFKKIKIYKNSIHLKILKYYKSFLLLYMIDDQMFEYTFSISYTDKFKPGNSESDL